MTNLERRKQLTEEFMQWFFQSKENRNPEPNWCKGQHCEDVNGDCRVCFNKWLNEEVRMTNFEKWKKRLAETEDREDFMYVLEQMDNEVYEKQCHLPHNLAQKVTGCEFGNCKDCKAKWLDMEVEE